MPTPAERDMPIPPQPKMVVPDQQALERAIAALRAMREEKEATIRQKLVQTIICPDCGATLKLETAGPLPEDIRAVFVRHNS